MAATATRRIGIRDMTASDLRAVRRVERAAYGRSLPGTPFERELVNGLAHYFVAVERAPRDSDGNPLPNPPPRSGEGIDPGEPGIFGAVRRLLHLYGREERIVGFAGVWYTVDQLHLVTIAVEPPLQGHGIAQRMLLEVYRLAEEAELKTIALEVRASNDPARTLYERFGFARAGMLHAYYSDNNEDAIVMLTPELASEGQRERMRTLRAEHARRYADAFEATEIDPRP